MKTAVIGVGHVGLVTVACLARWGHEVIGMDADAAKIQTIIDGGVPFHEPGLPELLAEGIASGRVTFSTDVAEALEDVEVAFICVGTPPQADGSPNLVFVEQVATLAATHSAGDLVLVEKSTVPASTGDRLTQMIAMEQKRLGSTHRVEVASNPEFLREGSAVEDTLGPDRVVVGVPSAWAGQRLREVYQPVLDEVGCPFIETDRATAELIKHASNAFLATKISFINAVAQISARVGADVKVVADGMGHDQRIGRQFLHAGLGYGGSCFPKDVDAFAHLARSVGYEFTLLEETRRINHEQREAVLTMLRDELWHLTGKTVTILGAAFKPGTDDLREAPGMWLAEQLIAEGATVRMYDPVAMEGALRELPDLVAFDDPIEACKDAHAVVIATEWDEVKKLQPEQFVEALAWPIVIDGRNIYEAEDMDAVGLTYRCFGRREVRR